MLTLHRSQWSVHQGRCIIEKRALPYALIPQDFTYALDYRLWPYYRHVLDAARRALPAFSESASTARQAAKRLEQSFGSRSRTRVKTARPYQLLGYST
jgi:hypothetical protein